VQVPGIVFARGGAVAILLILSCIPAPGAEPARYTVVTRQPRIPIGLDSFPEIPAGMVDGDSNFKGKAIAELAEETGIVIKPENLVDLTEAVYGQTEYMGMIPSSGSCDEFLRLFLYRATCSKAFLESLQGKLTGLRAHGELITLEVLPFEQLWQLTPDAKTLSALTLYANLEREGRLDSIPVQIPELTAPLDADNGMNQSMDYSQKAERLDHTCRSSA